MMMFKKSLIALLITLRYALSGCPYATNVEVGSSLESYSDHHTERELVEVSSGGGYVPEGGFKAVQEDVIKLMTNPKSFWPADFRSPIGPHYGGLFIRLAWHCSGSYREHDGRGGCDGGRIRFDPELNWPDNANLDKALRLLRATKLKYGSALSWGDLIVLAGNAAILSMNGPILGFCGGRIDDKDGSDSLKLGPSDEQEEIGPCQSIGKQGRCLSVNGTALGPTTVGLIYVNPGGPKGKEANPKASAFDVRTAFERMGFNLTETVALIGGGHAFGKMHGACSTPPCGDGLGRNTFTSGYEGMWTTTPTTWSNEYFRSLFQFDWVNFTSPGGKTQFRPVEQKNSTNNRPPPPKITMLTTDLAMTEGVFKKFSKQYSEDLSLLEKDFAHAWYRLTTADMGPVSRCIGDMIPPPQPFQSSLPLPKRNLPNYVPIRSKIEEIIDSSSITNSYKFIHLAYRCAATFQKTNYKGGCNGARIRFTPEKDWPENAGTEETLAMLQPIKTSFPTISYADLIVLAGHTAIERMTNISIPFCGGRVDADNAINSGPLRPRYYEPAVVQVRDDFQVKGLSPEQGVALAARGNLSKMYFNNLLATNTSSSNTKFSREELALLHDEFLPLVQKFSKNETLFFNAFTSGWIYLMTADRFKNNYENYCTSINSTTTL